MKMLLVELEIRSADLLASKRYQAEPRERLGSQRLDEVPHSVMAQPISGPTQGRRHRDELPAEERVDASGRRLPPPKAP